MGLAGPYWRWCISPDVLLDDSQWMMNPSWQHEGAERTYTVEICYRYNFVVNRYDLPSTQPSIQGRELKHAEKEGQGKDEMNES